MPRSLTITLSDHPPQENMNHQKAVEQLHADFTSNQQKDLEKLQDNLTASEVNLQEVFYLHIKLSLPFSFNQQHLSLVSYLWLCFSGIPIIIDCPYSSIIPASSIQN